MEPTFFRYIWRHSRKDQILLTLLAMASFPFLYLFYELPKMIINQGIGGQNIAFPYELFGGIEFGQISYLFLLCGAFLALVLVNQFFKYVINVFAGLTGERVLRRLRFELYSRVLRFPLPTFRKMSQGEIIPMITSEVEPLGGFVGDSFSLPAFQGGTLLTILVFLFYQDWRMALAAVMLYPLQIWIIPKLQRRVNQLGKERVRRVRRLADKIGETVQGVREIRAHDASRYVLANFSGQMDGIFHVRYRIYKLKFLVKFLNNFIQQLGPFFFYSIGGYFVITGQLEIGTLVAALAAHKDLAAPWKELLTYYQMQADAAIKYEQVVSQFDPPGTRSEESLLAEPGKIGRLTGEIVAANIILRDDQDVAIVDGLSFRIPLDKRTAIVGPPGSGREELALLIARLLDPERGSLSIGGVDASHLPEAVTGRRMAYIGESSFIFAGTLGDNLFFGLKHRPIKERRYEGEQARARERYLLEAKRSGNIDHDPNADWIDYQAAGADSAASLRAAALRAVELVGLDEDFYQFGLRGTINPRERPDIAEAVLKARAGLMERLKDPELAALVETFHREKYNLNATVAENLLFGTPVGRAFDMDRLAENRYVLEVLDKTGMSERFLNLGYQVATTMVELFADLPPDHELFQEFSFISAEELPDIQALLQHADRSNLAALSEADRTRLMSLPFKLIPARHRLGLIDDEFREQLLKARRTFCDELPEDLQGAVEFFDIGRYNAAANLQDNILFGKIAYGQAEAQERVGRLVREVIDALQLREVIEEAGLGFEVGIAGSRLTSAQRQKLALARALIKRPDVLILYEATAALDTASQTRILRNLLDEFQDRGLIWVVHRPDMAAAFDYIIVLRQGRVVEQGSFDKLNNNDSYLRKLVEAA